MGVEDHDQLHVERRAEWRAWLAANHETSAGVWLVSWKRATGKPSVGYAAAVEEALCFGWIDSLAKTIDDERSRQLFTRRRGRSRWSQSNRERVERLTAAGMMAPAGVAAVEAAKVAGTWDG